MDMKLCLIVAYRFEGSNCQAERPKGRANESVNRQKKKEPAREGPFFCRFFSENYWTAVVLKVTGRSVLAEEN